MNQPSRELVPGGRIGPYRPLSLLGESDAGVVYRGTDPSGRDVAIRVLRPEAVSGAAARRRLEHEIAVMRRVLSPHVVDVLDGDASAERPYVVSRFVPGRGLDVLVAEEGPLRGGALRRLALGLAKALVAIHEAGAVHRDLSPANVLVVGGEPVVIDFGVAQAVDPARPVRVRPHLAPEVRDGAPATPASDVYAWAATVAFAATGRAEVGDGAPAEVPEPLRAVLRDALRADPDARPTAAELVKAVDAADLGPQEAAPVVHEPVRSTPVERAVRAAAPPRSARPRPTVGHAWSRLLAVLAVVLMAAVAIVMPVVGIVAATAGALALRTWDAAALRGGPGRATPAVGDAARAALWTALTLPYAAVAAAAVALALASLVMVGVRTPAMDACAWGAGAGAAVLWSGPGVRAPRRQLERLFGTLAPEPARIVPVGAVLGVLIFAAVVGAVSLTPSFAPMYGLQNSVIAALDRFQSALP